MTKALLLACAVCLFGSPWCLAFDAARNEEISIDRALEYRIQDELYQANDRAALGEQMYDPARLKNFIELVKQARALRQLENKTLEIEMADQTLRFKSVDKAIELFYVAHYQHCWLIGERYALDTKDTNDAALELKALHKHKEEFLYSNRMSEYAWHDLWCNHFRSGYWMKARIMKAKQP